MRIRSFRRHVSGLALLAGVAAIGGAAAAAQEAEVSPDANPLRGAVVAFNLTACPAGWQPYLPAQGRFIRGINPGGDRSVDPDGVRAPGHVQHDELKAHTHSYVEMIGDNNVDGVDSTTTRSGDHHNEQRATGYTGGAETRPKNVALLYCEKR